MYCFYFRDFCICVVNFCNLASNFAYVGLSLNHKRRFSKRSVDSTSRFVFSLVWPVASTLPGACIAACACTFPPYCRGFLSMLSPEARGGGWAYMLCPNRQELQTCDPLTLSRFAGRCPSKHGSQKPLRKTLFAFSWHHSIVLRSPARVKG